MIKVAIIGASTGQIRLCKKARERGYYTIAFAWPQGSVCKDLVDEFVPISIMDMDKIVDYCIKVGVDGVVSNASELTTKVVAYVAEKLGLPGNTYKLVSSLQDKTANRALTENVPGVSNVTFYEYDNQEPRFLPCIVKPVTCSGKRGVSFVSTVEEFNKAIEYAHSYCDRVLVEQFVEGSEVSVETISSRGKHYVIQITDKENSGAPHFVELSHHQPSLLSADVKKKIESAAINILNRVGYVCGAAHIEMRVDSEGNVFLIELNPRGGGDQISNELVYLSTGYDYVGAMLDAAVDNFKEPFVKNTAYSGIYFLCQQTKNRIQGFKDADGKDWLVEKKIDSYDLIESMGNRSRNGHVMYQSDKKIYLD